MVTGDGLGGGGRGALLLEQGHPGGGSGGASPQLGAQLPLLDLPRQDVRHRADVVRGVNNYEDNRWMRGVIIAVSCFRNRL